MKTRERASLPRRIAPRGAQRGEMPAGTGTPARLLARVCVCALACSPLASCSIRVGGSLSQDQALAVLREENTKLRAELAGEKKLSEELRAKLSANASGSLNADALRTLPVATSLEIDSFSGVEWHADKAVAVIYLRTLDGSQHFVPTAGSASVTISAAPAMADEAHPQTAPTAPATLASATLQADAWRSAFGSTFLGTYYRVDVSLPPTATLGESVLVHAVFADAITGKTLEASRTCTVRPKPTAGAKRTSSSGE